MCFAACPPPLRNSLGGGAEGRGECLNDLFLQTKNGPRPRTRSIWFWRQPHSSAPHARLLGAMRCFVAHVCVLALGFFAACDDTMGGPENSDPLVTPGIYHLDIQSEYVANVEIHANGTFRWGAGGADVSYSGDGGRWEVSRDGLLLRPLGGDRSFVWITRLGPGGIAHDLYERVEVVSGMREGELIVSGVGERSGAMSDSWLVGGVCPVDRDGFCGPRTGPCDAPYLGRCSPELAYCSAQPIPECQRPEECDDSNACTIESCDGGLCAHARVRCADHNDCTDEKACDPLSGCAPPIAVPDGTPCAGGVCESGACALTSSVLPCTEQGMRNAVAAGGGPHTFDCDGPTTVVTGAEIAIDDDVTLDGAGNLIIDGDGAHRVLQVSKGAAVKLQRLTMTGGNAGQSGGPTPDHDGGGIVNFGMLTLENCSVSGNAAAHGAGGGIWNFGVLKMTGTTVSGNLALEGGGIVNQGGGVVSMSDCAVSDNHASRDGGGGIVNVTAAMTIDGTLVSGNTGGELGGGILHLGDKSSTSLTITDSTIAANRSSSAGGGIASSAPLTLINTTISSNEVSAGSGGGISATEAALALTNCTVSGNRALGDCGPHVGNGGGVDFAEGTLTVTATTFSRNEATSGGSAIFASAYSLGSTVSISNTLIDGDCGQRREQAFAVREPNWISSGGNVESPGDTCELLAGFDKVNVDARDLKLGPLQDNGGPTATHALGAGSIAIDAVAEGQCVDADGNPLMIDQRGQPRGTKCDVGAFELQP